nr:hypothetical protein [Tanacetum cinerariifolium]
MEVLFLPAYPYPAQTGLGIVVDSLQAFNKLLMERILKLHKKVATAKPINNDEEVDGGGG